jgi:hypothetical protein
MKYTKDFARYYISYQDNLSESDKGTLLNFVKESTESQVKALLYTGEMLNEDRTTIWNAHKSGKPTIWDAHKSGKSSIDLQSKFDKDFMTIKKDLWKSTKELKQDMRSSKFFGKTPIQKHRIWQSKQKVLDNKFANKHADLKFKLTASKHKLSGVDVKGLKVGAKKAGAVPVVGTIVVAAAIAAASYAIYKRFLSKAAKSCNSKKGAEKTLCMHQYKKKATQARIRNMRSQLSKCNKTKDPAKCKAKTMSTIKHLQSKI